MAEIAENVLGSLEAHDHFARLRNFLKLVATGKELWAGIPMPLAEPNHLVIEPKFPGAEALMAMTKKEPEPETGPKQTLRNQFWSWHRRAWVLVWDEPDGKISWGIDPANKSIDEQILTLGASDAWGIEQEAHAIELLANLVEHHQFKRYMLTGSFLESSPRSGVSYMFRRLRPTVAIKAHNDRLRVLCCLCLHPIGYYAGSWAGAMCPTDDVVAHLMLMRADERRFWRWANQHPAWLPAAGL